MENIPNAVPAAEAAAPGETKPLVDPLSAAPPQQKMMDEDYTSHLGDLPGITVRQKLLLKNACPCFLRNDYDVGILPGGSLTSEENMTDDEFVATVGHMSMFEKSTTKDKCCFNQFRKFKMDVYGGREEGTNKILEFDRPFRCPLTCCWLMPWPQELTINNPKDGAAIGKVEQDYRFLPACCGKTYFNVKNSSDVPKYTIKDDICCNANMGAPNMCCKIHKLDILEAGNEENVLGKIENHFPGFSCRSLCCGSLIDNYKVVFPKDASPEDKAAILGALVLIDFVYFSNNSEA